MADRLIKLPEVMEITSLSSSTIYRHIEQGRFPKQVRMGTNAVAWWRSEILAHIESRPRGSNNGRGKCAVRKSVSRFRRRR